MIEGMMKINIKKFNVFTIVSLLSLIAGILLWIWWGTRFGVWYDIGIYALTIILILAGIIGTILSLLEKSED